MTNSTATAATTIAAIAATGQPLHVRRPSTDSQNTLTSGSSGSRPGSFRHDPYAAVLQPVELSPAQKSIFQDHVSSGSMLTSAASAVSSNARGLSPIALDYVDSDSDARSSASTPPPYSGTRHSSFAPSLPPATPVVSPSEQPTAVRRHSPYSYVPMPAAVKSGVGHQPLLATCQFIEFPEIAAVPSPTDSPIGSPTGVALAGKKASPVADAPANAPHPMYISQIKFETTPAQLRWLIHKATRCTVLPARVDNLGCGWFVAWFETPMAAQHASLALHDRFLFDHRGVFSFPTVGSKTAVDAYMATREFRQRAQRLPRGFVNCSFRLPPSARKLIQSACAAE